MTALAGNIPYSNVKSRIHELPEQRDKLSAYPDLWRKMLRVQEKAENKIG
jgi:hypothetical protein